MIPYALTTFNSSYCLKILLFSVLLLPPSASYAAFTEKNTYIDQFAAKAREQKIWLSREWQALMHYSPELIGNGVVSLVDDADFFLSDQGKTSPQAELEATLEQLFVTSPDDDKASACRFPARRAWLTRALDIKKGVLPAYQCPHLHNWLNNMGADGLTLVFPVSVLNSPASMFGHTFLRFDLKNEKRPDLLAWTANYAAHTEGEEGLNFALRGLLGGYPGRFSLAPYHVRVKAYSDIENRDMWEYELNYSQAEINSLLLHLWELLPVYFDYYFIDENCSYQLLALLDAARPELDLTQPFYLDATPAETVRAITNVPGLLRNVNYRPSLRQVISERSEKLIRSDQELARALALGEITLKDNSFTAREDHVRAEILELAAEYVIYLSAVKINEQKLFSPNAPSNHILGEKNPNGENINNELKRETLLYQLLVARSTVAIKSQPPEVANPSYRPDQGHRGHRIGFRYGYDDPDQFLQIDFRWTYHDLYDPSSGFIRGRQLEFFQPAFRYYPEKNNFQFEAIDFVSIVSAPVRNYFIQPYSWEASAALKRYQFYEDESPLMGDFKAGFGISYQLIGGSVASIFANTAINISNKFDHNIALAGGGRAQVISTVTTSWKAGLYGHVMQYFEGLTQTSYELGMRQRFTLDSNSAIIFDIAGKREFGGTFLSAQLSLQLYF